MTAPTLIASLLQNTTPGQGGSGVVVPSPPPPVANDPRLTKPQKELINATLRELYEARADLRAATDIKGAWDAVGWFIPLRKKITGGYYPADLLTEKLYSDAKADVAKFTIELEGIALRANLVTEEEIAGLPQFPLEKKKDLVALLVDLNQAHSILKALGPGEVQAAVEVELKLNYIKEELEKAHTIEKHGTVMETSTALIQLVSNRWDAREAAYKALLQEEQLKLMEPKETDDAIDGDPSTIQGKMARMWLRDS